MHDHHSAGRMNLLPLWAQLVGTLLLAGITATHAVHLIALWADGARAEVRSWHLTHLAMGAGMLYMFAPWPSAPGNPRALQYLFATVTVVAAGWILTRLQHGQAVDLLWLPALIGMAAMAYMFLQHRGSGIYAITYLLVAYYLLEAAAWAQGWFTEHGAARRSVLPLTVGPGKAVAGTLGGGCRGGVRACQVACSLAMAYMFLAMDSGASEFFQQAFGTGTITEQSIWAVSLIAVAALACLPRRAPVPVTVPATVDA